MRVGMHPTQGILGRRWKMSWKMYTPPRDYLEDVIYIYKIIRILYFLNKIHVFQVIPRRRARLPGHLPTSSRNSLGGVHAYSHLLRIPYAGCIRGTTGAYVCLRDTFKTDMVCRQLFKTDMVCKQLFKTGMVSSNTWLFGTRPQLKKHNKLETFF